MKNAAVKAFLKRFHDILEEMDGYEADEEMEELNAQFEDTLFLIESIDDADEDWMEELEEALGDLEALGDDYADYGLEDNAFNQNVEAIRNTVKMARANMGFD